MGDLPPTLASKIGNLDIPLLGTVPADDELTSFEFSGKPLVELGNDSPVYQAVEGMLETIL
jgi:CO dehydrogenase nickel-insertion accessory protein CooC1